ncbi:MAG: DNA translocase FtsK [Muribaculaceae bacterium]|nr:DNA translocase FtsK [Muribaculaceae bacterium]
MSRFESYNPAIPDDIEGLGGEVALPVYDQLAEEREARPAAKPVAKQKKTKPAKSKAKSEASENIFTKAVAFFQSQTLRWIVGLFLAFFAIYLGIAFVSYFSSCIKDQSEINNTAIGMSGVVANAAGEGGARLSEFLINEFFGLGSFVIILWLGAIGVRLLAGKPRFKPVNFTIKCLVALITVSLIVGLLTIGMQTSVNWGGYHGRYVNEFIIHFLGWSGALLLAIFMAGCFVMICMRDVVKWIIKKRKAYIERRQLRRKLAEEERERQREYEEMRRAEDLEAEASAYSQTSSDDYDIDDIPDQEPALEMRFDADTTGLYSELPDAVTDAETDSIDKIYESDSSGKIYEYVIPEPHEEAPSQSSESLAGENSEVNTDTFALTQGREEGHNPEEVEVEKDEEKDEMVVNINTISQVDGKSRGVGIDSPEHFPYKFPPFELLLPGAAQINVDAEEQIANKERIKKTLLDFDIPIISIEATVGPTVTLYEIVPDKGIRVSKIRSLVDDIALSLAAEGIRIIAPIPGKGTVGIEVANKEKQTVSMRTVLRSPAFQNTKYKLPIALGSTISNEVFMADLAKMPHLLVAGATGQGKSVGLNAIITSLLYSKRPDELKFVMIDPKMVEFSLYAKIEGHYLAKIPNADDAVITDMDKVVATLSSLCVEMDNRYQLMKEAATKNIIEYNEKYKAKKLNPADGHKFMPYIVVIVDEFSDLIMTAGKEVEIPIARLAQKARAVGMHVIIATQRPSTNVITGIIKANFPARIAFKVSSGIDSKTILDTTGAQQLIGRGDMLVSNSAPMERVQCAFVDTPEVEKIADHIAAQPYQQGAYILPEPLTGKGDGDSDSGSGGSPQDRDPLFEEVARLVVHSNNFSTSSLQRRYSIGYNRAGKIMDQLEAAGIVGPAQGGKPRAVLMDPIALDSLLETLT